MNVNDIAKSAAEEIIAHNTFGQHSKIEDW